MKLDIPDLTEITDDMNHIQQWFTIAVYVIIAICICIILTVIYRILCCGVCLVKGVYSPFACLCRRRKSERLLGADPLTATA